MQDMSATGGSTLSNKGLGNSSSDNSPSLNFGQKREKIERSESSRSSSSQVHKLESFESTVTQASGVVAGQSLASPATSSRQTISDYESKTVAHLDTFLSLEPNPEIFLSSAELGDPSGSMTSRRHHQSSSSSSKESSPPGAITSRRHRESFTPPAPGEKPSSGSMTSRRHRESTMAGSELRKHRSKGNGTSSSMTPDHPSRSERSCRRKLTEQQAPHSISSSSCSAGPLLDVGTSVVESAQRRENGAAIVSSMYAAEQGHCDAIRTLLEQGTLLRLADGAATPAEEQLLVGFYKKLVVYLQNVQHMSGMLQEASQRVNSNYNQGLGTVTMAYDSLPLYLDNHTACTASFKAAQDLCATIMAQNPAAKGISTDAFEEVVRIANERIGGHQLALEDLLANGEIPAEVRPEIEIAFQRVQQHTGHAHEGISRTLGSLRDEIVKGVSANQQETYRVALNVLARVASGDIKARENFIYGVGATFGTGKLHDIDPYCYLKMMFERGSPEEQLHILRTFHDHVSKGASLPITPEGIAACRLALEGILRQLPEGHPEMEFLGHELLRMRPKRLPMNLVNSGSSSSSSSMIPPASESSSSSSSAPLAQYQELTEPITKEYLTSLQAGAKTLDFGKVAPDAVFRDLTIYLGETLGAINLSELDYLGRGIPTPTLSTHTARSTLVTFVVAQQILLSKDPRKAFKNVFEAFETASIYHNFDLATALSGAMLLWSVDRLSLSSSKQNDKLLQMAIQSGTQQKGMLMMEKAMNSGLSFFPNMATVSGAVTQIMEIPITQDGVVNEAQMGMRMKPLRECKQLVERGIRSTMREIPKASKNYDKIVQLVSQVSQVQLELANYGNGLELFSEFLGKFSAKYKPLPPE